MTTDFADQGMPGNGIPKTPLEAWADNHQRMYQTAMLHRDILGDGLATGSRQLKDGMQQFADDLQDRDVVQDWSDYLTDVAQRSVLFWDVLRQRGDNYLEHLAAGSPPVLGFPYEMVLDGRELPRKSNFALLHILPQDGSKPDPKRRPYLIIDPRAGQGAGIGGSKADSQVGVALRAGHPVYFAIFFPEPEDGQTLADVIATHAAFVRKVRERHPDSPRPIIVGNCQGGWSTMLLAASSPDITGPIVINGAPLAFWSGKRARRHPMRYLGGMTGGVASIMMLSDLGRGKFDGAHLISNFESFSPGNVWWKKYYDLFKSVDEPKRYLDFERWWGGFHYMTEEEIRWIVRNLFVGNRLARQGVHMDSRTYIDLRNIRSPIILFASYGDDITPPQQALNWIVDLYRSSREIRMRGQRIIYCLHKSIGHLGIFVSSKVAKKQHTEIASTMKTIESLPPGLYEMIIEDQQGEGVDATFEVSFEARHRSDIVALDDERDDEKLFQSVSRLSEIGEGIYEITGRPLIRSLVTPQFARMREQLHPLRVKRYAPSSKNPMMAPIERIAEGVREQRRPASETNPFVVWEKHWAGMVEQSWNVARDMRHAWLELGFMAVYGSPFMHFVMGNDLHTPKATDDQPLEDDAHVRLVLSHMDKGGFAEAVTRMLILMAQSRGAIRRSRLERSNRIYRTEEPFASMSPDERNQLIQEQSIIAQFEPEASIQALPDLLPTRDERRRSIQMIIYIGGPIEEMAAETLTLVDRFRTVLGVQESPQSLEPFHAERPVDAERSAG